MRPEPRHKKGDKIGGRYLVHKTLLGGMGEIYLCFDLQERIPLALKTFQHAKLADLSRFRLILEQEVVKWIALEKHPNIVRCFDMRIFNNQPFLTLEWIFGEVGRGADLRSWLRGGALNLQLTLKIIIDVCRGLIHAQTKQPGLVHRDLKPENILLAQGGIAKITDFGLTTIAQMTGLNAVAVDTSDNRRQSVMLKNGIIGTPAYMAPEQWCDESLDQRTDIYALGVIFYELQTGEQPFQVSLAPTTPAAYQTWLQAMQLAHETAQIPALPTELPRALQDLLQRCLAKSPLDRPATVIDLLNELTALYQRLFGPLPTPDAEPGRFTATDYNNRALTYAFLEQYELALADFNKALALEPSSAVIYSNRGLTYSDLQQHAQAFADYDKAIALEPGYSLAYLNQSITYADQHHYQQALHSINQAIRLDPTLAKAYYNRGLLYVALGQDTQALADFSRAIDCDPTYVQAHYNRGVTNMDLRQPERAVADFSRAIQLDPYDMQSYYNRGVVFVHLQQHTQAIADFTDALKLDPNNAPIYYQRGVAWYALEDREQALLDFEQALALDPNNASAHVGRGLVYTDWEEYEEAQAEYELALDLEPINAKAQLNLGALLANQGRLQEALPYFECAAALGDPQGEQHAARVKQMLTSPSMPPDFIQHAFAAFAQADSLAAMLLATERFPILLQPSFIAGIEYYITHEAHPDDHIAFAQRLACLHQIVQYLNPRSSQ